MDDLKNNTDPEATDADGSGDGFSCKSNIKSSGSDIFNYGVEREVSSGDLASAGSDAFAAVTEDVGFRAGFGVDSKVGNDTFSGSVSSKNEVSAEPATKEESWNVKNTTQATVKAGIIEFTGSGTNSYGYTSGRFVTGQGSDHSVKIGNEDFFITPSGGRSSKFGKDYSSEETHLGATLGMGPVEVGGKHTTTDTLEINQNDKGEEEKSESKTEKNEVSGALKITDGFKVKGTVETEEKSSFSQSKSRKTEEKSSNMSFKLRVEADSEKVGVVGAISAAIFNTTMKIIETVRAESEEDQRIHEELQRQSEELMNEYENVRGYDPQEYSEELEDYSYEANDAPAGAPKVDFSQDQGESNDYDYDYDYGYGY